MQILMVQILIYSFNDYQRLLYEYQRLLYDYQDYIKVLYTGLPSRSIYFKANIQNPDRYMQKNIHMYERYSLKLTTYVYNLQLLY